MKGCALRFVTTHLVVMSVVVNLVICCWRMVQPVKVTTRPLIILCNTYCFVLHTDIDECADSKICPNNSVCNNMNGSFTCDCGPGFLFQNGTCDGVSVSLVVSNYRVILLCNPCRY